MHRSSEQPVDIIKVLATEIKGFEKAIIFAAVISFSTGSATHSNWSRLSRPLSIHTTIVL